MKLNIQLFAEGEVIIPVELDTKQFDRQIKYIQERMLEIEYQLEQADKGFEVGDTLKLEAEYEKLGNQLRNLIEKREELNNIGTTQIQTHLQNIGGSLESIIRKVTRWGLALFSVRGAYSLIRNAISTIAQTDDGIATRIEYVRWIIANALKPAVEWVVNAIYKLLGLFGGLIKAITKYNIFANGTSESFAKTQKSADKLNKSTGGIKKNTSAIKKDLYGWDEMTRVSESGGLLGGGGSGGLGLTDDIANALDLVPDLASEVDKQAGKIKKWFLGGYDSLGEALKHAPGDIISYLKEVLKPVYTKVLKPYLLEPFKKVINETKPFWDMLYNSFKTTIENMKPIWRQFASIVEPTVITPIKNSFTRFKDGFLNQFAPFLNKIIDGINYTFGIFGINLEHIRTDADKAGGDIAQKIGGSLAASVTKAQGLEKEINKIPKKITTTINVKADTTNARKSLKDLIGDIGKAGIDGALGIKNYVKSMGIIGARKGAIINMPGRGVPVTNVVGGEAGREGIVPLTDTQQMELLGEAIGKYITINANITNTMNGRIISRELQKIQQENSFASNR